MNGEFGMISSFYVSSVLFCLAFSCPLYVHLFDFPSLFPLDVYPVFLKVILDFKTQLKLKVWETFYTPSCVLFPIMYLPCFLPYWLNTTYTFP